MENTLDQSNGDASNRMNISITDLQLSRRNGAQTSPLPNGDTSSYFTTQKTISSRTSRLSLSSRKKSFPSPAPPLPTSAALNPSDRSNIPESSSHYFSIPKNTLNVSNIPKKPTSHSSIPEKTSNTLDQTSIALIHTDIQNPTPEPEILPFADFKTPLITLSPPNNPPTPPFADAAPSSSSQETEHNSFNSVDSAKRRLVLEPEVEAPLPGEKRLKQEDNHHEESFVLQLSQRSNRRVVRQSQQQHRSDPPSDPLLSISQAVPPATGAKSLESISLPSSDEEEMNVPVEDMPTCDRPRIEAWLEGNRTPLPLPPENIKLEIEESTSELMTQPWFSPNNNNNVHQNERVDIQENERVVFQSPVKIIKEIAKNADLANQTRSPKAAKGRMEKGQTTLERFMIPREVVEVRTEAVQTDITGSDIERLENEVKEARTKATATQNDWAPLMAKMKGKKPDLRAIALPPEEETRAATSCPFYKKIGTNFAVDAFNYGNILGVTHYFLTHYHYDHYRGLKASINKPVVCSSITANLVKANFLLKDSQLFVMELNQPVVINDVEVTAVDANHCPGAVMFLFRFPGGKTVLHVGDFRFHSPMKQCPILNRHPLDEVYLDTTFCGEQYDFPKQHIVLSKAVNLTMEFCDNYKRPLIVCGTYTIGKEKVFKAIAQAMNWKIWVVPNKTRLLQCMGDKEILNRLTKDKVEANVHVVELREINQRKLAQYFETLEGNFDGILAFKPTGWEYEKNKRLNDLRPKKYGHISILGLPYSEHSSFSELKEFIQHFAPRKIIPTVNVGSAASRVKMEKLFNAWKNSF